ncbi:MAG: hypothetical protein ABI761_06590 [Saprospiraceae bacterium]
MYRTGKGIQEKGIKITLIIGKIKWPYTTSVWPGLRRNKTIQSKMKTAITFL